MRDVFGPYANLFCLIRINTSPLEPVFAGFPKFKFRGKVSISEQNIQPAQMRRIQMYSIAFDLLAALFQ